MSPILKLIPQLLAWGAIVVLLLRGYPDRRAFVAAMSCAGYAIGGVGTAVLLRTVPAEIPLGAIKTLLGASFFLLWGVSVAVLYRSTVKEFPVGWGGRFVAARFCAGGCALLAGLVAGAVGAYRLPGFDSLAVQILAAAVLVLVAVSLTVAAYAAERLVPPAVTVTPSALFAAVIALLLFCSSSVIRIDLFAPLSMKVMKGAHDFVHQFMESILIPDHIFVRSEVWGYIGLLFSKDVGFWGGMIIWFTPAILIALAVQFEPLPSVAHIRQGAQRRRLLADAIRLRRYRLAIPCFAIVALSGAAYQSMFPDVEYWDPKPLEVTATPAGEIFIPRKGEVDLEDGKLHKYLFRKDGKEARFFVLRLPDGTLSVDLDACAICKPDGYGQAEGAVICYYCVTLIPLETVGKPGGCNPVPIAFTEKEDGVHIDAIMLLNEWTRTVQSTTRIKEGGT
jgi:hypothetical protein